MKRISERRGTISAAGISREILRNSFINSDSIPSLFYHETLTIFHKKKFDIFYLGLGAAKGSLKNLTFWRWKRPASQC